MLDRKLLRDLARLWSQALAVALVMACGVMVLVLAVGAWRSLDETRETYYDRHRFADIFATATRAPRHLEPRLAAIDGVAAVELQLVRPAIVDMPGMAEPATGLALSLPPGREAAVNRLYLRAGRLPAPDRPLEVALDERFARAHGLRPGDRLAAILGGNRLEVTVAGIALSPEFIYAIGPGDMVPDDRRYAVFWMGQAAMEGLFDMGGAFDTAVLRLSRGACAPCVADAVDRLLAPYGGRGAHGRDVQQSHAFLDAELTQLYAMARVIPPIFLAVAAFLVNIIMSRLIALEREQIGLLKANGYSAAAIGWHYAKLVIAIAALGLAIGAALGAWLGRALTELYAGFFSFPFLVFRESVDLYLIAATVTLAAALTGAARAIRAAVVLPPAVAMRPPAPARFRRVLPFDGPRLSQLAVMGLRGMIHKPVRAALTTLGAGFGVALLVTALFPQDSIEEMIDTVFYRAERADAQLILAQDQAPSALSAIRRLPGVIQAEPFRTVPVVLRNGTREERIALTGRAPGTELSRILDTRGRAVPVPPEGVLLTARLAGKLDLSPGQLVEVDLTAQGGRRVQARVAGIVESYLGLGAHMSLASLDRLVGEGPRISGAWLNLDEARLDALYATVKATPELGQVALQSLSRETFRETIGENILTMTAVYSTVAVVVAFGVVYNAARIQLSERGRELASLRVLGFTRAEVFRVLAVELAVIVVLAQPLGWLLGYLLSWSVVLGFESDLFRIPFVIRPATYAYASAVVLVAALGSALLVRRRVNRLDLIRVLKTRE